MMEPQPPSPWMTRAEVAEYLRTGTRTVDDLRRAGKLTPHKFPGGSVRFSREQVETLIQPVTA